jgi:hypothetical protein
VGTASQLTSAGVWFASFGCPVIDDAPCARAGRLSPEVSRHSRGLLLIPRHLHPRSTGPVYEVCCCYDFNCCLPMCECADMLTKRRAVPVPRATFASFPLPSIRRHTRRALRLAAFTWKLPLCSNLRTYPTSPIAFSAFFSASDSVRRTYT